MIGQHCTFNSYRSSDLSGPFTINIELLSEFRRQTEVCRTLRIIATANRRG